MKPDTLKIRIVQYLEGKGFLMEGTICDYFRAEYGTKGETVARVCRMLRKDGLLDSMKIYCGLPKKYNAWRVKPENAKNGTSEVLNDPNSTGFSPFSVQSRRVYVESDKVATHQTNPSTTANSEQSSYQETLI